MCIRDSPSTVKIDRKKHMILVPYLYANGAEMNGLEQPVNANPNKKKKKRTLSDYGLGMMGGDTPRKWVSASIAMNERGKDLARPLTARYVANAVARTEW